MKTASKPARARLRIDALGVGAFRHAFQIGCVDCVAHLLFDIEAALVMGIGPAAIADGADKDKSDIELVRDRFPGFEERRRLRLRLQVQQLLAAGAGTAAGAAQADMTSASTTKSTRDGTTFWVCACCLRSRISE